MLPVAKIASKGEQVPPDHESLTAVFPFGSGRAASWLARNYQNTVFVSHWKDSPGLT